MKGLKDLGLDPRSITVMRYSEHNRPFLPGSIDFSIAHSDAFSVCAIAENVRVGIDIEIIREIQISDYRVALSDGQWQDILNAPDQIAQFLAYWVRKEAVIKADGRGMVIPLAEIYFEKNIGVTDRGRWFLNELEIDPRCHVQLACNIPGMDVELIPFEVN